MFDRQEPPTELPWVERLPSGWTAVDCFQRLADQPACLFLDSALAHRQLGRYSFVTADPFHFLAGSLQNAPGALEELRRRLWEWRCTAVPGLPPFQGGAAGLFAYDLNRIFERIPQSQTIDFPLPVLAVGFYDVVLAFDHQQGCGWLISTGLPEPERHARLTRARQRAALFRQWLDRPLSRVQPARPQPDTQAQPASQYPVPGIIGITSNFSREQYLAAIERVIEYIRAGDVFQVNLSQRLLCAARWPSSELYLRLRKANPAPFAGYFDLGAAQVLSSSPERFLCVRDRHVETRPIKGTCRRLLQPEATLFAGDVLRQSEKDRAENVMIVDLLRNDLSRVCRPESVRVAELCSLETYQYVLHLVSVVVGCLRDEVEPMDLLPAAFPGGSVTGAPKVRAMQIIAELEPTPRGAYCGSLGYIGFDGTMDLNILIRTITASGGWWQIPVGGGITIQSQPLAEYRETLDKAAGMLAALRV